VLSAYFISSLWLAMSVACSMGYTSRLFPAQANQFTGIHAN